MRTILQPIPKNKLRFNHVSLTMGEKRALCQHYVSEPQTSNVHTHTSFFLSLGYQCRWEHTTPVLPPHPNQTSPSGTRARRLVGWCLFRPHQQLPSIYLPRSTVNFLNPPTITSCPSSRSIRHPQRSGSSPTSGKRHSNTQHRRQVQYRSSTIQILSHNPRTVKPPVCLKEQTERPS